MSNQNLGQRTERRILKKIGARRQPASGAIPGFPNDGIKNCYLIEIKSTEKQSLSVKREWMEVLEENAILIGKVPVLVLVFNGYLNRTQIGEKLKLESAILQEWVAIPRRDFEALTSYWNRSKK